LTEVRPAELEDLGEKRQTRFGLPVVTEQQRTLSAIIAGEIMALAFVAV